MRPPTSTSNAPASPPTSESVVELLVAARQAPPPEWVDVTDVIPLLNRPGGSGGGGGGSACVGTGNNSESGTCRNSTTDVVIGIVLFYFC